MKWCVWSWVVMTIIPHASHQLNQECPLDDVRAEVNGINTDVFRAGHIEVLCSGSSNWRPLCGDKFDANAARVICAELGFPMAALHYTDSCLGSGDEGGVQLSCAASDIDDCTIRPSPSCEGYAGVICRKDNDTCPSFLPSPSDTTSSCDCPTPPPSPPCDYATREGPDMTTPTQCANDPMAVEDNCTALGGGLGILSAVLAILLVGVVLGWVWSYHRRRKSGILERSSDHTVTSNPSYTSTPHTSIQYSSIGPRDTPTNNATPTYAVVNKAPSHDATPRYAVVNKVHAPIPPGGEGDRIYHVLEATGEGGVADYADLDEEEGGGDYHMLGEEGGEGEGQTYEVPVSSSQKASP